MPEIDLQRVIHSPVLWTRQLAQWEQASELQHALTALEALPESSYRDVRCALVLWRLGRYRDAKSLIYKHHTCRLAKAYYFAFLVEEGNESTLEMIAKHPAPDWENVDFNDLEAEFRTYICIGMSAGSLRKYSLANRMFIEALRIANGLKLDGWKALATFENARARLFNGRLLDAKTTFYQVCKETPENTKAHNVALEYITLISWFEDREPSNTPYWCQALFEALKHRTPIIKQPAPAGAALPWLVPVLSALKELTDEWHQKLPLMYTQENSNLRAERIKTIREIVGDGGGETPGFLAECALALATSMDHCETAPVRLQKALSTMVSGIPLVSMVYFATLLQCHCNLPHAEKDTQYLCKILKTLKDQFKELEVGQQRFLTSWMQDFCPSVLFLLSQDISELQAYLNNVIVVSYQEARLGGRKILRYPKRFMAAHIMQILSGQPVPVEQRHQAHRHRLAVVDHGASRVVFLATFATWLHR